MNYEQKLLNEFRFLNWDVYKDAKEIVREVYLITEKFPTRFKYNLGDQLNRAVISIVLNIAED